MLELFKRIHQPWLSDALLLGGLGGGLAEGKLLLGRDGEGEDWDAP